jgi:hypothetical protein
MTDTLKIELSTTSLERLIELLDDIHKQRLMTKKDREDTLLVLGEIRTQLKLRKITK